MRIITHLFLSILILLFSTLACADNFNRIYSVGTDGINTAYLWSTDINGNNLQQIPLVTGGGSFTAAHGIVLTLFRQSLLLTAVNEYSPLVPLKGLK